MAFRRIAQMKEISLEYVSPTAAGTLKFFTDLPGSALAERTGGGKTLPVTPADKSPQVITYPLVDANGAPIEASLWYPRVDPPATGSLQLRGGTVWMRIIGCNLDGSRGEFFDTLPVPVGV